MTRADGYEGPEKDCPLHGGYDGLNYTPAELEYELRYRLIGPWLRSNNA